MGRRCAIENVAVGVIVAPVEVLLKAFVMFDDSIPSGHKTDERDVGLRGFTWKRTDGEELRARRRRPSYVGRR